MQKEPIILNIESATGTCSVAVSRGDKLLHLREAGKEFDHSRVLTTLIGDCLKASGLSLREIDAVAVSSGPGSYTSLRVGASTAKGICYALGKPLLKIDTLQALALGAQKDTPGHGGYYCPMIDARRMEVYCSIFDRQNKLITGAKAMVIEENSFGDLFEAGRKIVFCGTGAEKCQSVLTSPMAVFRPSKCSAANLPSLSNQQFKSGNFADIAYFTPFYLKPPNITVPKNMNLLKA
ncbi:MAG TPA: tRNA (adenosine(37)-N6)-threonylcarbamoyltransferase complex dimerization subunit type 1 TsaB [Bacteroidetes bacterium]|nr:tRNA (adenosine(37)-N6)-threonylcarbamoyltransferase complex dimerization subunit type 1 TsaB [Bacteroidota bacterium]